MGLLKNRASVPQGMLAPNGYVPGLVNPYVQATTRPAGTLLVPSAGYDSVRRGKNRFQGRGPTGGFRPMEFAEDLGAGGAVLSVIPGQTTAIEASEWLPESPDSLPEGSVIIADRTHEPGFAQFLHQAYATLPDMGDREAARLLTRSQWLRHPLELWRKDYAEHPGVTVLATAGLVYLINIVLRDAEASIRGYHPRGVGQAVTEPAGDAVRTGGDVVGEITKATDEAVTKIGSTVDAGVSKIASAADGAVSKIENAAS